MLLLLFCCGAATALAADDGEPEAIGAALNDRLLAAWEHPGPGASLALHFSMLSRVPGFSCFERVHVRIPYVARCWFSVVGAPLPQGFLHARLDDVHVVAHVLNMLHDNRGLQWCSHGPQRARSVPNPLVSKFGCHSFGPLFHVSTVYRSDQWGGYASRHVRAHRAQESGSAGGRRERWSTSAGGATPGPARSPIERARS